MDEVHYALEPTYNNIWHKFMGDYAECWRVLRDSYTDRPDWHLYLLMSRLLGVSSKALKAHKNPLEKVSEQLGYPKNFWESTLNSGSKYVRLSYDHFGCLNTFVRLKWLVSYKLKITKKDRRKPNPRKYERINQTLLKDCFMFHKLIRFLTRDEIKPGDQKKLDELEELFVKIEKENPGSVKKIFDRVITKIVTRGPRNRRKTIREGIKRKLRHVENIASTDLQRII